MNNSDDKIEAIVLIFVLILFLFSFLSIPHVLMSGFSPCKTKGAVYLPMTKLMCFLLEKKGMR